MSIEETTYFGRPAFRWGKNGKLHMYNPADANSRRKARDAAGADGALDRIKARLKPKPVPVVEKIVNYQMPKPKPKKKAKKK